ncbi:hypothetical protein PENSPDRAFT_7846 [Peniophora sp. CONT]|nr:hypothetical protein PENSPDRAFT_7846 [Peniophora sp. CONT]
MPAHGFQRPAARHNLIGVYCIDVGSVLWKDFHFIAGFRATFPSYDSKRWWSRGKVRFLVVLVGIRGVARLELCRSPINADAPNQRRRSRTKSHVFFEVKHDQAIHTANIARYMPVTVQAVSSDRRKDGLALADSGSRVSTPTATTGIHACLNSARHCIP